MDRAKEIEKILNSQDTWDMDLLKELCDIAGLSEEWNKADAILYRLLICAIQILNIDI